MDVREKAKNDKRLIDANALISYMDECSKESRFRVYYGYAESFINVAPTVDAVEVVRCLDCKHFMFSDCYGECGKGYMGVVRPDDFCSYGERRADNG